MKLQLLTKVYKIPSVNFSISLSYSSHIILHHPHGLPFRKQVTLLLPENFCTSWVVNSSILLAWLAVFPPSSFNLNVSSPEKPSQVTPKHFSSFSHLVAAFDIGAFAMLQTGQNVLTSLPLYTWMSKKSWFLYITGILWLFVCSTGWLIHFLSHHPASLLHSTNYNL